MLYGIWQYGSVTTRCGPVSCLAQLNNYIVMCAGRQVQVHMLNPGHPDPRRVIEQIAFFDHGVYAVDLHVVKNFVVVTDAYKCMQLLYWRQRTLELKGKDAGRGLNMSSQFVIDPPALGIVQCDDKGNLEVRVREGKGRAVRW
jgi:hypothetical protein